MPRTTGSFQKEIEKIHTLRSLVQSQKSKNEPVGLIFKNVYYIYQKVAAGLNYLHHKGLVHGDIKASNILILKPPTCCCHSALLCTCQYKVFISDFDGVGHGSAGFLRIVVLHSGTLFYRAPEAHLNVKGLCNDLWSIGCSLNHLILGRYSADEKKKVFGIGDSPKDSPLLLLAVETYDAYEQLVYLRDNVCKEYPEFAPLVRIISDCLNLDYKQRITASILYEKFVLLYNN